MSLTLGCQRGDVFRAVASCSGGMVETGNCRGNPTVWLRTGQADSAGTIQSVTMARDFWLDDKGCSRDGPQPVPGAPCLTYRGCRTGTRPSGWPAGFSPSPRPESSSGPRSC